MRSLTPISGPRLAIISMRGYGSRRHPAQHSSTSSRRLSAATVIIHCRRARSKPSSVTARGAPSMHRRPRPCCSFAPRSTSLLMRATCWRPWTPPARSSHSTRSVPTRKALSVMNSIELSQQRPDVLVIGAGNAALCATISAHEHGARVLMLEAAPFEERGGNSHFTGGAFRFAYRGVEDLITVLPSLASEDLSNVDFGTYTEEQFFDDMFEVTEYRTDSELCEILVHNSLKTATWVAQQGVKLQPGLGRQAYKVDGKFKFWGGLALHIWGGGPELLKALYANVERRGIAIVYETPAVSLMREHGRVAGVVAEHNGTPIEVRAGAVVLACGSFESNHEMRVRYLGPNWELAKSRGTRFNMGAGLTM